MNFINRNVSIVIIILVLVVIAGYLVWLRNKYQPPVSPKSDVSLDMVVSPTPEASSSGQMATPSGKEATGSMKAKNATSPAMAK